MYNVIFSNLKREKICANHMNRIFVTFAFSHIFCPASKS